LYFVARPINYDQSLSQIFFAQENSMLTNVQNGSIAVWLAGIQVLRRHPLTSHTNAVPVR